MDKVKAIKVLKPLVDSYVDYANITMKEEDDDIADALEMAIEALKALDVPDMNVGDMISRQAAIDALKEAFNHSITKFVQAKLAIENLPSAQPRKKGEWIPEFNGKFTGGAYWFSCSKCNRIVPEVRNGGWNFCPNCGADMRGEEND